MANLAQMVNVLQSVILTEGEKMILTPTYHVFHMYRYHQDAELVESFMETKTIGEEERYQIPNLQESVSVSKDGKMHITLNNLSITEDSLVEAVLTDAKAKSVTGTILTNEMHAHNTFENPDCVKPETFTKTAITERGFSFTIPACSVLHLEVEIDGE